MASKVVVMREGRVEQIGPPLELYDRPCNLFVASFIGSPAMNFLPGLCEGEVFSADCGLRLPMGSRGAKGRAVYGIRPEHCRLNTGGVEVEVIVVEPLGAETQLVLRSAGQDIVCVAHDRVDVHPGQTISIQPDVSKVHLFDEETGVRL